MAQAQRVADLVSQHTRTRLPRIPAERQHNLHRRQERTAGIPLHERGPAAAHQLGRVGGNVADRQQHRLAGRTLHRPDRQFRFERRPGPVVDSIHQETDIPLHRGTGRVDHVKNQAGVGFPSPQKRIRMHLAAVVRQWAGIAQEGMEYLAVVGARHNVELAGRFPACGRGGHDMAGRDIAAVDREAAQAVRRDLAEVLRCLPRPVEIQFDRGVGLGHAGDLRAVNPDRRRHQRADVQRSAGERSHAVVSKNASAGTNWTALVCVRTGNAAVPVPGEYATVEPAARLLTQTDAVRTVSGDPHLSRVHGRPGKEGHAVFAAELHSRGLHRDGGLILQLDASAGVSVQTRPGHVHNRSTGRENAHSATVLERTVDQPQPARTADVGIGERGLG